MKSSQTIFLKPGDTINIDGVEMSYDDIINSKIDSVMYRKNLKKLMEAKT